MPNPSQSDSSREDLSTNAPITLEDSDSVMEDAIMVDDKKILEGAPLSASDNEEDEAMDDSKDKMNSSDNENDTLESSESEDTSNPQISESEVDLSNLSKDDRQIILDLVPADVQGEEKKFYISLYKWLLQNHRKKLPPKTPIMGYKYLDLYIMYKEVTKFGGYKNFNSQKGWNHVHRKMHNYRPSMTSASNRLKRYYEELLLDFEKEHFHTSTEFKKFGKKRSKRRKSSSNTFAKNTKQISYTLELQIHPSSSVETSTPLFCIEIDFFQHSLTDGLEECLPITSPLFSYGNAIYFPINSSLIDQIDSNAVVFTRVLEYGQVAFTKSNQIVIGYGTTPSSIDDECRVNQYCIVCGKMRPNSLMDLQRSKMQWEDKTIVLTKINSSTEKQTNGNSTSTAQLEPSTTANASQTTNAGRVMTRSSGAVLEIKNQPQLPPFRRRTQNNIPSTGNTSSNATTSSSTITTVMSSRTTTGSNYFNNPPVESLEKSLDQRLPKINLWDGKLDDDIELDYYVDEPILPPSFVNISASTEHRKEFPRACIFYRYDTESDDEFRIIFIHRQHPLFQLKEYEDPEQKDCIIIHEKELLTLLQWDGVNIKELSEVRIFFEHDLLPEMKGWEILRPKFNWKFQLNSISLQMIRLRLKRGTEMIAEYSTKKEQTEARIIRGFMGYQQFEPAPTLWKALEDPSSIDNQNIAQEIAQQSQATTNENYMFYLETTNRKVDFSRPTIIIGKVNQLTPEEQYIDLTDELKKSGCDINVKQLVITITQQQIRIQNVGNNIVTVNQGVILENEQSIFMQRFPITIEIQGFEFKLGKK